MYFFWDILSSNAFRVWFIARSLSSFGWGPGYFLVVHCRHWGNMMVSVGLLLLNHLLAWFYNHISTIEAGEIFYLLWHDYDDGKFEEEVPCFAVKTDIIANDYDYFNLPGKAIKSACRVVMTQKSKDYKLKLFFRDQPSRALKLTLEILLVSNRSYLIPFACMTHSLGKGMLLLTCQGLIAPIYAKGIKCDLGTNLTILVMMFVVHNSNHCIGEFV